MDDQQNPQFEDWTRDYRDADNLAFFRDALRTFEQQGIGHGGVAMIGLVGQGDRVGVKLRQAQRMLRWDRRPSLWSHAFLVVEPLADDGGLARLGIREVVAQSRAGAVPDPAFSAVTEASLGHYAGPRLDPNVALLAIDMDREEADAIAARAIERAAITRERHDLWELLVAWQQFLWTSDAVTPLKREVPMFSSALIDHCFQEVLGLDLQPGTGLSTPEALWNTARLWAEELGRPITGYYVTRDPGCAELGPEELEQELAPFRF